MTRRASDDLVASAAAPLLAATDAMTGFIAAARPRTSE